MKAVSAARNLMESNSATARGISIAMIVTGVGMALFISANASALGTSVFAAFLPPIVLTYMGIDMSLEARRQRKAGN